MALPELPAQGQNPWYTPRTNWDLAVEAELEGRLSEASIDSQLNGRVEKPALAINSLTGWLHLDGAGLSASNTAAANATILQDAFDVAGSKGTVYLSEALGDATILVQAGVVTVTGDQVTLIGSLARSEYTPRLKGVGSGPILNVTGFGFNAQGVNFMGDGTMPATGAAYAPQVDGIRFDRSDVGNTETLSNLDHKVRDCQFGWFRESIYAKGRNIDFLDNIFSNCVRGVKVVDYPGAETRGFRFNGNRFHSIGINAFADLGTEESYCIDIPNTAFANQVIDNYVDMDSRNFYRGPARESAFNDNQLWRMTGTGFTFIDPSAPFAWTVSGNSFFGRFSPATNQATLDTMKSSPSYFIRSAGNLSNGSITGNNVRYTRYQSINIATAGYLTITGNQFIDAGIYSHLSDGLNWDGVFFGNGFDNVLTGNTIRSTSPNGSTTSLRDGINLGTSTSNIVNNNKIANVSRNQVTFANNNIVNYQLLTPRSSTSVPNNAIFVDSSDNVLKVRDNAGTLRVVNLT